MLEKTSGRVRFEIMDGGKFDAWVVGVSDGDLVVSHEPGAADCVLRTDREVFDRLATGQANAMAALLRGAVAFEGRPELLIRFQRLFPASPRTAPAVSPVAGGAS